MMAVVIVRQADLITVVWGDVIDPPVGKFSRASHLAALDKNAAGDRARIANLGSFANALPNC
jgi:hypothetical protein